MTRLVVVAAAAIGLILFVAFVTARLVRSRTRGLSIRMQVFLALAATVGAFAFGLGLMVIDRIEARAVRLATQAAEDEAAVIAAMIGGEIARTGATLESLAGRMAEVSIADAHLSLELRDRSDRLVFPRSNTGTDLTGTVSVEQPIYVADRNVGVVRVHKPTLVMRRLLADFAPTVLVISLVLGAATALAAAWIGRAIAAPIESLSAFSERVSDGVTASPPVVFGREVTRLRGSIDSMRRQLEGRPFVETFAADLSHELKNPVAAIRASAEVLDESALDEPEAARRFTKRILECTARIERLLGELVSLARIEARGVEDFPRVDLRPLVEGLLQALDDADRRRVRLHTDGDLGVRGDPAWLGRAIRNLIDNAVFHTPSGNIHVDVTQQSDRIVVAVRNPGDLPRHVRERVFSRFVTTRADKGGTGLGLAIVRAVAEAHAGQALLASGGPPEVEFQLVIPSAGRRRIAPERGLTIEK